MVFTFIKNHQIVELKFIAFDILTISSYFPSNFLTGLKYGYIV